MTRRGLPPDPGALAGLARIAGLIRDRDLDRLARARAELAVREARLAALDAAGRAAWAAAAGDVTMLDHAARFAAWCDRAREAAAAALARSRAEAELAGAGARAAQGRVVAIGGLRDAGRGRR